MGMIPKISCRRCHREFSAARKKCPYCGTRRTTESTRSAAASASAVSGTEAHQRANTNARYQMIFGGVIMCAVVIAVIVLIVASLGKGKGGNNGSASVVSPSPDVISTPSPTMEPTPSPSPTVLITSITFTYGGAPLTYKDQFATSVGNTTKLGVTVYPIDTGAVPVWSSEDESIATVDQDGLVTAIKAGWTTIYAECGGMKAACKVYVQ